ncbi:hypothetical protein BU14_0362s0010 [Porphyra umbilicalis]|uniref:IGFBP N-terminal domain-containing protein n=1 Tax=Porphyra umbilicalis TaxID=2786 RepID=A0A1X6NXG7_PORUM|nr:hypothetical protein BU14_0362s0010 [Porphyra umbilicalis]|eukprot:OSX73272.1 hypothetical protein BU14_0362s0010 [Porphyra umbilicalis]
MMASGCRVLVAAAAAVAVVVATVTTAAAGPLATVRQVSGSASFGGPVLVLGDGGTRPTTVDGTVVLNPSLPSSPFPSSPSSPSPSLPLSPFPSLPSSPFPPPPRPPFPPPPPPPACAPYTPCNTDGNCPAVQGVRRACLPRVCVASACSTNPYTCAPTICTKDCSPFFSGVCGPAPPPTIPPTPSPTLPPQRACNPPVGLLAPFSCCKNFGIGCTPVGAECSVGGFPPAPACVAAAECVLTAVSPAIWADAPDPGVCRLRAGVLSPCATACAAGGAARCAFANVRVTTCDVWRRDRPTVGDCVAPVAPPDRPRCCEKAGVGCIPAGAPCSSGGFSLYPLPACAAGSACLLTSLDPLRGALDRPDTGTCVQGLGPGAPACATVCGLGAGSSICSFEGGKLTLCAQFLTLE